MVSAASPTLSRSRSSRRAEGHDLLADRPLSPGELRFAQLRAQGWPLAKCYAEVSGQKKRATCETQGWRWQLRPAVMAEIVRLRSLQSDATAMQRTEKRNILATLARDDATPAAVRVGAIQVDNRMTGDDEPVRVTVSGRVVFTVDPIGDGTRGQLAGAVSETELPKLDGPASEATINLAP